MRSGEVERLKQELSGHYQFERELGTGAFATVFLARDLRLERHVAIKVLHLNTVSELNEIRFLREIRFLATLQHPNIVPVHESGHVENLLYYVMPYVRGESLRERIRRDRQLPIADAVRITAEIADALEYAHNSGVIHRDIKPENILLSGGHPMLADFGVARAIRLSTDRKITETGFGSPGTPAYMSPEQMLGDQDLDQRTDIYSLGCVLYEMLTGKAPFEGSGGFAKRFAAEPPSAQEIRTEIHPSLDRALMKSLARNPGERFPNAAEMVRELLLSERSSDKHDVAVAVAPGSPVEAESQALGLSGTRSNKPSIPRLRVAFAGAVALLLILGASPAIGYFRHDEKSPSSMDPRRIAVLDFEDQSPNHVLGHIASGLTVSLIQELSSTAALQVVSRNTVKTFQDRALGLDSLIDGLRLGTLVEGTVQQSDGRLRVTAQLVDGASQMQLESATIERPMGELFLVEDDLAHQVAQLLRRRIGTELRIRATIEGTRNAEARDLVFRADKLRDDAANASSADSLESAEAISRLVTADSLLAATEGLDPNWIAPVVDRGWIALELSRIQGGPQRVHMLQQAKAHADRAVGRDSLNAAALQLRGTVAYWEAARLGLGDRDFRRRMSNAEADLTKALSIDSSLATAWGVLSLVNVARGELAEADRDARTALAMDTYLTDAPLVLLTLYGANLMKGAMSDAWRWCQRGEHDYPGDLRFVECHLTLLAEDGSRPPNPTLASALVRDADKIDPPAHAKAVGRAYLPVYREMMAAAVYARAGDAEKARSIAATASRDVGDDPELRLDLLYEQAYVHLLLGERTQTIALLSEYLRARPSLSGLVARHVRWRPLWSDSTFAALVHKGAPVLK